MAIDYEETEEYLKSVKAIEKSLEEHQELFNSEKLIEFKQVTRELEKNIETTKNKVRKLSIGIVGAVKAGKSSFLNALIFGGEEYLPKAATPMTAALTKITYSDKPKAVVHFYTEEDWSTIEAQAKSYDEELEKRYGEYLKKYAESQATQDFASPVPYIPPMGKAEYEKECFKCKSETQKGAKELVEMAADSTLMDKLGGADEIEGDIISQLKDYVGAEGHYTPIVSYVELQVDNPNVQDFEIVDTPGLNDPIVSRGMVTKKFLRECDVVLLLSQCSPFMDASTVNLMANRLPSAGVNEILVVGSKLDSGILNEKVDSFMVAMKKSLESYKTQFCNNLAEAKKSGRHTDILNKMDLNKLLFVSSTCYVIAKKKKEGKDLDEDEQTVYKNLGKFKDFDDKYLTSLGGISKVQQKLNEVLDRKKEIIEDKDSKLLDNARRNHLLILEKILQETISSRMKLETTSAEELRQRTANITATIDSSRKKLTYVFEGAAIDCDAKVQQILPELTKAVAKHEKIAVEKEIKHEHETKKVGLFGLRREIVKYDITEKTAETSCVIDNIKRYSAECQSYVNVELQNIFNKEKFVQKIKEVVLDAFNQSQKDFDEDDILLPLQNVLAKIAIPHINFDYNKYIDEVEVKFEDGEVKFETKK